MFSFTVTVYSPRDLQQQGARERLPPWYRGSWVEEGVGWIRWRRGINQYSSLHSQTEASAPLARESHSVTLTSRALIKVARRLDGTSCLLQKQEVFVHRYIRYPFSQGMAPLGQIWAGYPRTGQASDSEGLQG